MATLEQRVVTLEKQVGQGNACIHVVFCQDEEPTQDERAEAAQHEHAIMVMFVAPKGRQSWQH